jgi:dihydroorotate dehydrogenase
MGFNNPGADAMAETLQAWRQDGLWPNHPVGMNLGKSKITPLAEAAGDYAYSLRTLHPWVDFFVVNVSSPNTPNLRQLQNRDALSEILHALEEANQPLPKPILIKVAPDLSWHALDEIVELALDRRVSGLVATNTTMERPSPAHPLSAACFAESGGLSGRPLRRRSTEVIRHLHRQARMRLPIIGVGGVFGAEDAWEKILAGASLLQIYTGLVFQGPGLIRQVIGGLQERLRHLGIRTLSHAVGLDTPS